MCVYVLIDEGEVVHVCWLVVVTRIRFATGKNFGGCFKEQAAEVAATALACRVHSDYSI